MEKLQPVIRQIFWVLFGLGLILIMWAWYSANSALSASIDTEKAKVETTKTESKKNVMGLPNGDWTKKAEDLNEKHREAFDESAKKLWEQQLAARVYPDLIRAEINQLRFRSQIPDKSLRGIFRTLYNDYFDEQLSVIQPFELETGLGLVDVQQADITREDPVIWKNRLPTSQEIWNAQEDIWLVRSLLDAIAETNGSADRIDRAPIRSLLQLKLRGGDPEAGAGGENSGGEGADIPLGTFTGLGELGAGGNGAPSGVWTAFQGDLTTDLLTEEFGVDPESAIGVLGVDDGGQEAASTDAAAQEAASTKNRYVHYGEELPYKTRAFSLSVRMIQRDIPTLLTSLPNGKFPVEIVRVDVDFAGGQIAGGLNRLSNDTEDSYGAGLTRRGFGGFGQSTFGALRGNRFGSAAQVKKPMTRKEKMMSASASGIFDDAMKDELLATVRVAGLMTIYESPEEKAADAEAEDAAQSESNDSAAGLPPIDEPSTEIQGTDTQNPGTQNPDTQGGAYGSGSTAGGTAQDGSTTKNMDNSTGQPNTGAGEAEMEKKMDGDKQMEPGKDMEPSKDMEPGKEMDDGKDMEKAAAGL